MISSVYCLLIRAPPFSLFVLDNGGMFYEA